jgi:hypothetical protein
MHFPGPDTADLANVYALNRAFIAWQRARPQEARGPGELPAGMPTRLAVLSCEQRERLARSPFLLLSLAEDDEPRWQSLFAEQQTRDLLQCAQPGDEAATTLIAGALGFLWQLSRRNPYAARLLTGASLGWCEQLAGCTLMDLFARTLDDRTLLAPRMANHAELWHKLLTAGVSSRRQLRRAARVAALQTVLTERPLRSARPLAAAACSMPAVRVRRSRKPQK